MRLLKIVTGAALLGGLLAGSLAAGVAEHDHSADPKTAKTPAKPYSLKTCIVSGEKLGGDMGKPYLFVHEGQQFKLCCKGCLKDFNKEPAKYIKKLTDAQKNAKDAKAAAPAHDHTAPQHL